MGTIALTLVPKKRNVLEWKTRPLAVYALHLENSAENVQIISSVWWGLLCRRDPKARPDIDVGSGGESCHERDGAVALESTGRRTPGRKSVLSLLFFIALSFMASIKPRC